MKRLLCTLALVVLVAGSVMSAPQGGKRIVAVISDWGQGMVPVLAPYTTPSTIAYYKNIISSQTNGAHLRYGYRNLLPDSTENDTTDVTAVAIYSPTRDSSYVIHTAGGLWYGNQAGQRIRGPGARSATPSLTPVDWLDTVKDIIEIRPYRTGTLQTSAVATAKRVWGTDTRFIRDLMPGDSITIFFDTNAVTVSRKSAIDYIYNDFLLTTVDTLADTVAADSYHVQRTYPVTYGPPYLVPSGEFLYTGNAGVAPQVIYTNPIDSSVYLRELVVVDSFLIDTIYNISGRQRIQDETAGASDSTYETYNPWAAMTDSTTVLTMNVDFYRTWDTATFHARPDSFNVFLNSFQIVSRRKAWLANEWRSSKSGAPESFYIRLSSKNTGDVGRGQYYTVAANDDSSLYLNRWVLDGRGVDFQDDTLNATWNDSLFYGVGLEFSDTLTDVTELVGTWGYIMTSSGAPDVIVEDRATSTLHIAGGGAMCYTVDNGNFPVDTNDFYDGLYFIRLTGGDLVLPGYVNQLTRQRGIDVVYLGAGSSLGPKLESDDSLLSSRVVYGVFNGDSRGYGTLGRQGDPEEMILGWFDNWSEAHDAWYALPNSDRDNAYVGNVTEYRIRRGRDFSKSADAVYLQENTTLPIVFTKRGSGGDTLYFVTGVSSFIDYASEVSTTSWELLRVKMPRFADMTTMNKSNSLIGWGDSTAPATVSISPAYQPWRFSASGDIVVGDFSTPLTALAAYDGNVLAFKHNMTYSTTAQGIISEGIGAVGPRAVCVQDASIYFLAADGVYRMDRREQASGYSTVCISRAIDPILQSWSNAEYGDFVAPIRVNRAYMANSILVYNPYDHHLWLWVPTNSGNGVLNTALTYDIERNIWDGYHTIPAASAIVASVRDTNRVVIGSTTHKTVYAFAYVCDDAGTGIDGVVQSKSFALRDEQGRKIDARLSSIVVSSSTIANALDSLVVTVGSENGQEQFVLDVTQWQVATATTIDNVFYSTTNLSGRQWWWKVEAMGKAAGSTFRPIELEIEWIGLRDK